MGPNLLESADLVTFTKEILNGKLNFLCSVFLYTRPPTSGKQHKAPEN